MEVGSGAGISGALAPTGVGGIVALGVDAAGFGAILGHRFG